MVRSERYERSDASEERRGRLSNPQPAARPRAFFAVARRERNGAQRRALKADRRGATGVSGKSTSLVVYDSGRLSLAD